MLMDWNYKCLWDLNSLNCLKVPSTNNGNEGANSRFLIDFWSFCLDACSELERDNADIPSIMYGTLIPAETPLYSASKEQREVVMANFEVSLIDLDGYLGKIGSISLRTGMAKFSADDEESGSSAPKRKGLDYDGEGEANEHDIPSKKRKTTGAAIKGRIGRSAKNTGKELRNRDSNYQQFPMEVFEIPFVYEIPVPLHTASSINLPWPNSLGLQSIPMSKI